jgi:two-component system catabolic regulation response regulator CreB
VLSNQRPDLVVKDLVLPEVDGLEVARRLREWGDAPIVVLRVHSEERDGITGLEMGRDDCVVKPTSPPGLVVRERVVLRRSKSSASPVRRPPGRSTLSGIYTRHSGMSAPCHS